jgi:hypothetical protein
MPEAFVTAVDPPYDDTATGGKSRTSWRYTVNGPGVPEKLFTRTPEFAGLQQGSSYEFGFSMDDYGNGWLDRAILVTQVNGDMQQAMPGQPIASPPTVVTPPHIAEPTPPQQTATPPPAAPPPGQMQPGQDMKQQSIIIQCMFKCASWQLPPGTDMTTFMQRVGELKAAHDSMVDQTVPF